MITGDIISYGTECRIKHLATKKYLVVEKRVDGNFEVWLSWLATMMKTLLCYLQLFQVVLKDGRCKQRKDIFIIRQSVASSAAVSFYTSFFILRESCAGLKLCPHRDSFCRVLLKRNFQYGTKVQWQFSISLHKEFWQWKVHSMLHINDRVIITWKTSCKMFYKWMGEGKV